jgi:hypothetical protein
MDYWQRIRQAVGHETVILPGVAGAIAREGKILLVRHGRGNFIDSASDI